MGIGFFATGPRAGSIPARLPTLHPSGLGLESRARQLSPFWSEHLSRTRAAQARWAPDAAGNLLTVLGAGPMLDLNLAALQGYFRKFRFVDANPLLVFGLDALEIQVDPLITDLTNCVDNWLKKVKAVGRVVAGDIGCYPRSGENSSRRLC